MRVISYWLQCLISTFKLIEMDKIMSWLNGKCWNDEIEDLQNDNQVYQKSKKYKEL